MAIYRMQVFDHIRAADERDFPDDDYAIRWSKRLLPTEIGSVVTVSAGRRVLGRWIRDAGWAAIWNVR